jgi:hypothetical protein
MQAVMVGGGFIGKQANSFFNLPLISDLAKSSVR